MTDVETLRKERDAWKAACARAGVCMSCAVQMPDPHGCFDCQGTGWDGGTPVEAREAAASLTRQTERVEELERALERIYRVGDGYGPHRPEEGRHAGTTGEGHARCREIAAEARRARSALDEGRAPSVPGAALDQT